MPATGGGRFRARFAETDADVRACQRLRYLTFRAGRGLAAEAGGLDADRFDALCRHAMVEDGQTGDLVCCFRLMALAGGAEIENSYSAQWYGLGRLHAFPGRMVELGRFCIHPDYKDPTILRLAWSEMSRFVDQNGIALLFGCSSFHGLDPQPYADAFALLKERHLAPARWRPEVKAPKVFPFAAELESVKPDLKKAMAGMPPLLRTYLVMGGWVSDHAVVDEDLKTLHVFTGVEVGRVPEGRARVIRRAGA